MADGQKVTPQELLAMYKKSQATVARLASRNDELTRENSELIDKLSQAESSLNHTAFELKRTATTPSPTHASSSRVVPIEQTGKKWKLAQLLGCGGALLAFVVFAIASSLEPPSVSVGLISILVAVLCAMGWLAARVGAWWHHG